MRRICVVVAFLLLTGFAGFAHGSDGENSLWVDDQVRQRKKVDFNERCGAKLDPKAKDDARWSDPCRTVSATDLKKVILSAEVPSEGVRLVGVRIDGQLNLADSEIKQPLLIESSRLDGGIDLTQARLQDPLDLNNSFINGPFVAAGLRAERRLTITFSFLQGNLDLHNAKVDSNLSVNGSIIVQNIDAYGLEVLRNCFMRRGSFIGRVELSDAKIGGNLDLEQSKFADEVKGVRLNVAGSIFMNNRAIFRRDLVLHYAAIGGHLEMEGQSHFTNIKAESLQISRHLFMGKSTFHEFVSMPSLRVSGYLDLSGGTFSWVDFSGSVISQELRLSSVGYPGFDAQWPPETSPTLNLTNAQAGTLQDDNLTAWPARVDLDGFTYMRLQGNNDRTVEEWESWLQKNAQDKKRFNSQPYTHLAKILAEAGHRDRALELQFAAREGERWQAAKNGEWPHWAGLSALRWLSGYGIGLYTFIAVPWAAGSVALGVLVLRRSRAARAKGFCWCIGASLEKLLPVVELNKEFSDFFFDPKRERLRGWQLGFFGVYALWGWILGLVLIAAMSGLTQGS